MSKGVFDGAAEVEHCVSARCRWLIEILCAITSSTSKPRITTEGTAELSMVLKEVMESDLPSCDAMLANQKAEWKKWWAELI